MFFAEELLKDDAYEDLPDANNVIALMSVNQVYRMLSFDDIIDNFTGHNYLHHIVLFSDV